MGEKNGLLKKLLKLVSSPQENLAFIVEDIAKKGLSVRKVAENEYEILYKGQILKIGKDSEVGAFLKKYFWKSIHQAGKELLKDIIKAIYSQLRELRTPAREILRNEDVLINYKMKHTKEEMLEKAHQIMKDLRGEWYKDNCIRKINFHEQNELTYPKNVIVDTWGASINSIFDNIDFLTISDETGEPIFIRRFTYQVQEIKKDNNGKYYILKNGE